MSTVSLCRVCLRSNIRMKQIANTKYEEIFHKLSTKLRTDQRPETLCYICYSQLQRCCNFMAMSRKAEEILTQFSRSGIQLTEQTVTILERKFVHKLSWTPIQILCVNEKVDSFGDKVDIKEEYCDSVYNLNDKTEDTQTHNTLKTIKKEVIENEEENELTREIDPEVLSIKQEINSEMVNEIEHRKKPISNNEQYVTKVKNKFNNTKEPTDEDTIIEVNTEIERPAIMTKLKTIKQEINELSSREKLSVAVEEIKLEYESDLEAEFETKDTEECYEVSVTNAELSERVRYPCEICGKGYTQKCHLYRHMKIHHEGPSTEPGIEKTIVRDYTCELCGKTFIQKCSLKKHLLNHTGEKPYACDLCPTRCLQKIDMVRHMRMHTGQKPFQCDTCKQKFSRKSNMKLHMLTHVDSKPFICHICNSSFSRRYDLNRHNKRKHTGEKPYSCDICDFRSVNASYLKTHMENRHLKAVGEKPYSCLKCDFKCANAGYLKIHDGKKHLKSKSKSKSKIKKYIKFES